MDSQTVSTENGAAVVHKAHSCDPSHFMHGQVGSTATWKCGTPEYPGFTVIFKSANPFNQVREAMFEGTEEQPLKLTLQHSGHFEYSIQHTKKDGSKERGGPYCIVCVPPPMFYIPPRKCPPNCGSGTF